MGFIQRTYRSARHAVGQAYGGPHARRIRGRKNAIVRPLQQAVNGAFFPINIRASIGIGGCLMHVLNLLDYADARGLRPVIRMTGKPYRPAGSAERSWFHLYFNHRHAVSPRRPLWFLTIRHHDDYPAYMGGREISIARAAQLFEKYIEIRPEIVAAAEAFIASDLPARRYFSVHLRVNDKLTEAEGFDPDRVRAVIERVSESIDHDSIFLATDAHEIESWFRETFPDKRIVVYGRPLADRSPGPVIFSDMDGREKAVEALVLILIMASSQACIRTASIMSAFAKILNLDLPVVMLTRPFDECYHFPDRELWEAQLAATASVPAPAHAKSRVAQ